MNNDHAATTNQVERLTREKVNSSTSLVSLFFLPVALSYFSLPFDLTVIWLEQYFKKNVSFFQVGLLSELEQAKAQILANNTDVTKVTWNIAFTC